MVNSQRVEAKIFGAASEAYLIFASHSVLKGSFGLAATDTEQLRTGALMKIGGVRSLQATKQNSHE